MSTLPDHDPLDPLNEPSPEKESSSFESTASPSEDKGPIEFPHEYCAVDAQVANDEFRLVHSLPEPNSQEVYSELPVAGSLSPVAAPSFSFDPAASDEPPLPISGDLPQYAAPPTYYHEQPRAYAQSWDQPEPLAPKRIPHLGHLGLLTGLIAFGWMGAGVITLSALHFHLFGVSTVQAALTDIHYTLGSMITLYLFAFGASVLIFPLFWGKQFFVGIQWNGATALRMRWWLFGAAFACFVLAIINGLLMPGPDNTPIDKMFRAPGAAWLLFAFGVTAAPFFEEVLFRGFLLPALCTAYDWSNEKITHRPPPSLDANGHPQWSFTAMAVGSILTSIPFALMHAEQTGYTAGPFVLLICVSLVLCGTRLFTRSLAASVFVHACYNCLLFSFMLLGTGGFQHLDKM